MLRILLISCAALALAATALADNHEKGDAAKGAEAFQGRCLMCHFDDSAEKKIGPGLAGIKDGKLPSGKKATWRTSSRT